MKYVIALDSGTTSCRAILFDRGINVRQVAQREFHQIYPENGWVEHDAVEIWNTQLKVFKDILRTPGISTSEIAAVGITNQRETTVVWDKHNGEPIYNAIVWQDRRTADYCAKLKAEGKEAFITEKTGLLLDPYFSGTKLRWILENVPGAREKAERGELLFGTIDTWLIWNLTAGKVHATDPSNASRTMLYNIKSMSWDSELLEMFNIPESMLPKVKENSEVYGVIDESVAEGNIKIAGVAGDQQAATFGQGCFKVGSAKNTYGTGCFALFNTGETPVFNDRKILTTVAWNLNGKVTYALEGSVFIGGAVVEWLRDNLKFIDRSSQVESQIAEIPDNGGVYCVPAFTGLGAPYWDPYARGIIVGISRGTTKEHISRAAVESIAFQSADILTAMSNFDAKLSLTELKVDGGASKNNFLMQFQADLLNCVVVRPKVVETTALGVAFLAGLAVGFWSSAEEIISLSNVERTFEPKISASNREHLLHMWHRAVSRSAKWALEED